METMQETSGWVNLRLGSLLFNFQSSAEVPATHYYSNRSNTLLYNASYVDSCEDLTIPNHNDSAFRMTNRFVIPLAFGSTSEVLG